MNLEFKIWGLSKNWKLKLVIFATLLGISASLLFSPSFVLARDIPAPSGLVNDFAQMLSPAYRASLENDLQNFEKQTGAEITLATIDSLGDSTIEDRAAKIFQEWGIGKKHKDNGVLLLIAKEERQARIEVGYGLESYITDGRAGEIIRSDIVPNFREGNYDEGIRSAISSIKNYILKAEPETTQEAIRTSIRSVIFQFFATQVGFFLFIFFLLYIANFLGRSQSIWLGGVIGGFFGIVIGWLFISLISGIIFTPLLAGIGLFLDSVLSRNYQKRKASGLPTGFWISGGGFNGGGGGGGFGGFGGGSSGGGGASGKW